MASGSLCAVRAALLVCAATSPWQGQSGLHRGPVLDASPALLPEFMPAGPLPPLAINPEAVHNRAALRRLWQAMAERRISFALVADSNGRILETSGHEVGMAKGLRPYFPYWGSRIGPAHGRDGWAANINGQGDNFGLTASEGAPAFLAGLTFPAATGFVNGGTYVDDTAAIPHFANTGGLLFDEVPFDGSADLEFHYCYATFGTGSGAFRPRIRLEYTPWTEVASGGDIVTAPLTDGMHWGVMEIPAGDRSPASHFCGITQLFGPDTEGPVGLTYTQFVVPAQATGVTYGPLWQVGGEGSHRLADHTINDTTAAMWDHWFDAVTRHQGVVQAERTLCLHIVNGGNDHEDTVLAIDADGNATGPETGTAAGHRQNMETFLNFVDARWAAAGYAPENLYYLIGPYHPKRDGTPAGEFMTEVCEPVWVALSQERANVIAMLGSGMLTGADMDVRGWYRTGDDDAHLSQVGYLGYGAHTWATAAAAAAASPANDLCGEAAGITEGAVLFTTIGASTDGPAHGPCFGAGPDQISTDIWYRFLARASGTATIGTCGSGFDTRVAVYDGAGCDDLEGRILACSDDDACPLGTQQSEVTVVVMRGQEYTIRVGGTAAAGEGVLTIAAAYCYGDFDSSGVVNSNDISAFLVAWLSDVLGGTLIADFNEDLVVNSNDISAFLSAWLAALPSGC